VLRFLALDSAELVRRALAVTLKMSPDLPHDVALSLAQDVDSVATPLLRFSPVFLDEDLAEIIEHSDDLKQIAVGRRAALSPTVTAALAQHGCEPALRAACANDNADFTERSLQTAMERFERSEALAMAMAYRKALPTSIAEKLLSRVSDQVRQHLIDHHGLSSEVALITALAVRERATVDLVDQADQTSDLKAFCAHLRRQERLTPSLLLRALVNGNISFFEWGLAELTEIPHHRVWMMVHDGGPLGLHAIYRRAELPETLYPAFRAAIDAFQALHLEGGDMDLRRFQERLMQRFLTQNEGGASEDVDYLLARLDSLTAEPSNWRREVA
jgi:uncharacterized protein (DUF2336 family)